ncbi:MAG: Hpt domain-containing protein [Planctomycetes bacterium]|nr:Hpt domain-containing protein [Planctomycetota bacterium]
MLIDLDLHALERLQKAGGLKLVQQMVTLFLEHAPRRLDAAAAGLRGGDWGAVERAGHSMKSSAAYLGLSDLVRRAAEIEALAVQGRGAETGPLIQEMSEALPGICALLQRLIPAA